MENQLISKKDEEQENMKPRRLLKQREEPMKHELKRNHLSPIKTVDNEHRGYPQAIQCSESIKFTSPVFAFNILNFFLFLLFEIFGSF